MRDFLPGFNLQKKKKQLFVWDWSSDLPGFMARAGRMSGKKSELLFYLILLVWIGLDTLWDSKATWAEH